MLAPKMCTSTGTGMSKKRALSGVTSAPPANSATWDAPARIGTALSSSSPVGTGQPGLVEEVTAKPFVVLVGGAPHLAGAAGPAVGTRRRRACPAGRRHSSVHPPRGRQAHGGPGGRKDGAVDRRWATRAASPADGDSPDT